MIVRAFKVENESEISDHFRPLLVLPSIEPEEKNDCNKSSREEKENFKRGTLVKTLFHEIPALYTPFWIKQQSQSLSKSKPPKSNNNEDQSLNSNITVILRRIAEIKNFRWRTFDDIETNHPLINNSLFIFTERSNFRAWCQKIINFHIKSKQKSDTGFEKFSKQTILQFLASQTILDGMMVISTTTSTIAMLFENPYRMVFDSLWSTIIEYAYISILGIEFILKTISDGLIFTPHAYARNFQGSIKLFHVIVAVIHAVYYSNISSSRPFITFYSQNVIGVIIRTLRCTRPLAVISMSTSMMTVIQQVISGWRNIFKVSLILLVFLNIFSYYSYSLFNNKLVVCNDPSINNLINCTGNFMVKPSFDSSYGFKNSNKSLGENFPEILVPRARISLPLANFDNLADSYLSSFLLLTIDAWDDVASIIELKMGTLATMYVYIYLFISNMVVLSMFIGVIVQTFNENVGTALLTVKQRRWQDFKKRILLVGPLTEPQPSDHPIRKLFYYYGSHNGIRIFESFLIFSLIVVDFIASSSDATKQDEIFYKTITQVVITSLLILVHSLIFLGLGVVQYIKFFKLQAVYDISLFVVLVMGLQIDEQSPVLLTIFKSILKSFYLLFVLIFITECYALAGVVLFGLTRQGKSLDNVFNFQNSYNAFYVLFSVANCDGWAGFLFDAAVEFPYCTLATDFSHSDCGNKVIAILYFISYLIIVTFIFLNLLIAMVLSNFSLFAISNVGAGNIVPSDISFFQLLWKKFDPDATGEVLLSYAEFILLDYYKAKMLEFNDINYFTYFTMKKELSVIAYGKNYSLYSSGELPVRNPTISFHQLLFIISQNSIDPEVHLTSSEQLERDKLSQEVKWRVASEILCFWFKKLYKFKRLKKDAPAVLIDDQDKLDVDNNVFESYENLEFDGYISRRSITSRSGQNLIFSNLADINISEYGSPNASKIRQIYQQNQALFIRWYNERIAES